MTECGQPSKVLCKWDRTFQAAGKCVLKHLEQHFWKQTCPEVSCIYKIPDLSLSSCLSSLLSSLLSLSPLLSSPLICEWRQEAA